MCYDYALIHRYFVLTLLDEVCTMENVILYVQSSFIFYKVTYYIKWGTSSWTDSSVTRGWNQVHIVEMDDA